MLPSGDGWLVHDWQRGPRLSLGESTEVRLTHELRDTRWLHAFHRRGWRKSFDNLERLL